MNRVDASQLTTPTAPSTAYAQIVADGIAARAGELALSLPAERGAPAHLHDSLLAAARALGPQLVDLSHFLHANPELGYAEHQAAAAVADLAATAATAPVEVGVGGLPTALRARLDFKPGPALGTPGAAAVTPGVAPGAPAPQPHPDPNPEPHPEPLAAPHAPTIAIACEYDALPEIGHACGHNVMAATAVGAFLALAALRRQHGEGAVPGNVVLLGTPAEEGGTGKEVLIRAGVFDSLDAAVMTHAYGYDLADQLWLGCRRLTITYTGVSAHASSQPHMARNALDAAALAYQGIGMLRQHMAPGDRLHAVIVEGGRRASIIPERAQLKLYVRSAAASTLKDLCSRVDDVAAGAALMTGCGVEVEWDPYLPVMPVRTNAAMTQSWVRAQEKTGRHPLPRGVVPETLAASTDFGNVSHLVPAIHPLIKVAGEEVALHTRAMAQAAGSQTGDAACVDGAYGLAAVVLDLLHDSALLAQARAEFEAAGGVLTTSQLFS